jgi:hypothetical protein
MDVPLIGIGIGKNWHFLPILIGIGIIFLKESASAKVNN